MENANGCEVENQTGVFAPNGLNCLIALHDHSIFHKKKSRPFPCNESDKILDYFNAFDFSFLKFIHFDYKKDCSPYPSTLREDENEWPLISDGVQVLGFYSILSC